MPTIDSKIIIHPFVKGMEPEHLETLSKQAREKDFEADQVICHENQSAHQVYLILEGKAVVESYMARADDIPLQTVESGDVLGWSGLFPPFTWHFQARAIELTKTIFLDCPSLITACERDRSFGYVLMQRIAQVVIQRLQATLKRLLEIQSATAVLSANGESKTKYIETTQRDEKSVEAMLSEHPFLAGMSAPYLKILTEAATRAEFAAGEIVFREGDVANRFYLIQHGKVVLEGSRIESTATPIQTIGGGELLGWSWMFPPFYSHFDARALEPTTGICLYGTRLHEQCEANHDFGYDLMMRVTRVLIQRLESTRQQLVELHRLKGNL